MYSFSQRLDTKVFDEVLYAYYLSSSGLDHPGREKIIKSLGTNSQTIINEIVASTEVSINFYKLMTYMNYKKDKAIDTYIFKGEKKKTDKFIKFDKKENPFKKLLSLNIK